MRFREHYFTESEDKHAGRGTFSYVSLFNRPGRVDTFLKKIKDESKFAIRKKGETKEITFPVNLNSKAIKMLKDRDENIKNILFIGSDGEKYRLAHIVKTKEFVSRSLEKGTTYEAAITNAWNKKHIKEFKVKEPTSMDNTVGKKIADYIDKQIKTNQPAINIGANKNYQLSRQYVSLVNSKRSPDRTPKTDVLISEAYRMSLKLMSKTGRIRLASPQVIHGEGQALIYNALNKANVGDEFIKTVDKWVKPESSEEALLGRNVKDLEAKTKIGLNHKEFERILNNIVANNSRFKQEFIKEAVTGDLKFIEQPPKANYFLKFNSDASVIEFAIISSKIKKLANQVKILVNWKTSGNSGSSTILDVQEVPVKKETTEINVCKLFEYAESLGIDCDLITEDLNEGFMDKIKKYGTVVVNFMKRIYNAIVQIIKKGLGYFLKFFQVEADITDINEFEL